MPHELAPPADAADWQAFHDIREDILFVAKGRPRGTYNRNHPDDFDPANTPLLLKHDGRPVGVIRLDRFGDGTGAVRLVAVVEAEQGGGHGRAMSLLCDGRAREAGIHTLYVNAAPGALGFYEKMGWERHVWDPDELIGIAEDCVQMRKVL